MILDSLINYRNKFPQLGLPSSREQFDQSPIVIYETLYESGFIDLLKSKADCSCVLRTGGTSSLSHKTLATSHVRFTHNDRKVSQALLLDLISYKGPMWLAKLMKNKVVFLCGNMFEDGDQPVRYVSNALVSERGWMGERICPVPQSICDGINLPDTMSKLQAIARCYNGRNPAVISGVPSVIFQFAQAWYDLYGIELSTEVLIVGGCRIQPYVDQLHSLFGELVCIIPYYNATEGSIGYQPPSLRDTHDYDTLMLQHDCGIYYEFVEPHNQSQILSLDQIHTGVTYILLISTYDGLCRYQIGDLIEFSDTSNYYFRIVGRTSEYIDIANEHSQIQHIQSAVNTIREQHMIGHYCVYPQLDQGCWYYQRVIESDQLTASQSIGIASQLDQGLQTANDNYAAKRNTGTLGQSQVQLVSIGTFDQIINDLNQGKQSTQSKLLTLYPSKDNPVSKYCCK